MAAPEGAQRAPILRSARPGDQTFLRAMLFEAAFWRPCEPRPAPTEALSDPKLARYVGHWGARATPASLRSILALTRSARPGTACSPPSSRLRLRRELYSRLSLSVTAEHRRRGIGDALLGALLDRARAKGLAAVSLSVEVDNPALALYRRHSFVVERPDGNSLTMVAWLRSAAESPR